MGTWKSTKSKLHYWMQVHDKTANHAGQSYGDLNKMIQREILGHCFDPSVKVWD